MMKAIKSPSSQSALYTKDLNKQSLFKSLKEYFEKGKLIEENPNKILV